jgi:hypothetical protein
MALKITTQIGTNKGITSEAYIRISKYLIDKAGYGKFDLQIFQKEEDATPSLTSDINVLPSNMEAKSAQIGDFMHIKLFRTVTTTVKKNMLTPITETIQVAVLNESGQPTGEMEDKEIRKTILQEQDVDIDTEVPDMTSAVGQDIFTFGYAKLKEELSAIFGAENIVDC